MNAPRAGDGRQDGMILIVVLWAVSLMTLAVVAISALSQKSISVAGAETDRLRSEMALEAGIAAGEGLILATAPDGRALLDGTPLVIDVGFGRKVEVRVRDASGLVDINRADLKMIEGLIAGLDIDPLAGAALFAAIRELRPEEPETATDGSSGDNSPQQQPQADAGQPAQNGIIPNDQSGGGPGGQTAKPPVFASVGQLYGLRAPRPRSLTHYCPLSPCTAPQAAR